MKNISLEWTTHLSTKEERKEFQSLLLNSGIVLGQLRTVMLKRLAGLDRSECNPRVYDNANWAYRQAHANGMRNSYQQILDLLKFLDKE